MLGFLFQKIFNISLHIYVKPIHKDVIRYFESKYSIDRRVNTRS